VESTIAELIDRGARLIASAKLVGDGHEHAYWRLAREKWCSEAASTLEATAAPASARRAFEAAVWLPAIDEDLFETLAIELRHLREGLAVLEAAGAPPPSSGARGQERADAAPAVTDRRQRSP
jgi:hypothetical protein